MIEPLAGFPQLVGLYNEFTMADRLEGLGVPAGEQLILVDSNDEQIGIMDRATCHDGRGMLHRAVSVFLFNQHGHLLVQRRHESKQLWGGSWSNSCCTHPRPSEPVRDAAERRVREELGISVSLRFVYKFEYHAQFNEQSSEWELCSVFVGQTDQTPTVDESELSDWSWASRSEVDDLMRRPDVCTPWFRLEWSRLQSDYSDWLPPQE